jgi:hypothetical protein
MLKRSLSNGLFLLSPVLLLVVIIISALHGGGQ